MNISERLLFFIWEHRLFDDKNLTTTAGKPIEIIDPGLLNQDEGPDFINAKIKIENQLWFGSVEIHRRSSDWIRHEHSENSNYQSVILHVVEKSDAMIRTESSEIIPELQLAVSSAMKNLAEYLLSSSSFLPCHRVIRGMDPFLLKSWLYSVGIERMMNKSNRILNSIKKHHISWDEASYRALARSFGFGINSAPFEELSHGLPLSIIQKNRINQFLIETLLFGCAGMLDATIEDDAYFSKMINTFEHFRIKYNFSSANYVKTPFKYMRMRPESFPEIRLSQLSELLFQNERLFSKIIEKESLGDLRLLFHVAPSKYWQTHYRFGNHSEHKNKFLGTESINVIIINAVCPILFAYGKYSGEKKFSERAISFLTELPKENNKIVRMFMDHGVPCLNALDSQALIELKNRYCDFRKCLFCRIGYRAMTSVQKIN